MVKWHSLVTALALSACVSAAPHAPPRLELLWRVGGLANPESVALSRDGSFLYVSNVSGEGEAKDGNGFIARVSTDGHMLQRTFAVGLNGPKGVVLRGDALFVADIDQLVVIDASTGAIRRRLPVPGAEFLNDIAVAPNGDVLAADSNTKRIYVAHDGQISVWLEHDLLRAVNGLLPERNRLVVTTMAGRLLAVDYRTRAITVLAEGLGDGDGVAALSGGRYLVSEWPGVMHVVAPDGSNQTILNTRGENRYLNDFLLVGGTLYQPHWEPSELSAYRVVDGAP
jgi:DNA-binding beta-propeller fold protein YncE